MKARRILALTATVATAVLLLSFALTSTRAAPAESELAALAKRAQIEDTLVDYYALFFRHGQSTYGDFYTEDGVLDVNGIVRQGRGPINDLYKGISEGGNVHLLISNEKVVVSGEAATADLLWTEFVSANHGAAPRVAEQGREHDDLVRRNGRWYFAKRVVTNDGGLPASLEKNYKER